MKTCRTKWSNKRIGAGTTRLFETTPGARVACLGPLGRPFEPAEPPAHAWMVAGGVGLAVSAWSGLRNNNDPEE